MASFVRLPYEFVSYGVEEYIHLTSNLGNLVWLQVCNEAVQEIRGVRRSRLPRAAFILPQAALVKSQARANSEKKGVRVF